MNPTLHNGKVDLWTRQHKDSLQDLKSLGRFRTTYLYLFEAYGDITNYHTDLYRWFVEKARRIVPKPEGVNYPVWCSVSKESTMPLIEDTVIYHLSVDEKDVIYFDGGKWDYVLNHLYVPRDEKDLKEYRDEMKNKGFSDKELFTLLKGKKRQKFPQEVQRITDSWDRIFEISEWNPSKIQGNIWEFTEEQILKIIQ